jgi:4-amino-4-deoxy-L-arabinose transferase-like glycosyltransferase
MWNEIRTVEPNPPLMYLLLRGWIALAGAGEFATRYFSVFWGVLCVPLAYRLAASLLSPYPLSPLLSFAQERGEGDKWGER